MEEKKDRHFVAFAYDKKKAIKLKVIAAKLNISRSELIRQMIERHLPELKDEQS